MAEQKEPKGFKKAWNKADELLSNSKRLQSMLQKAVSKKVGEKTLKGYWGDLQTFVRLIRDYASGAYREVATSTLLFALAAIVYFVNPFDVIPDFILGFGFLDDITVITFVISKIKKEIDDYLLWESQKPLEITATDSD